MTDPEIEAMSFEDAMKELEATVGKLEHGDATLDQSIAPADPSSSNTARCSLGHTPAVVHAVNRRCAVAGDTPNDLGSSRQGMPEVRTYTTAVNTARSSTGAVPPP